MSRRRTPDKMLLRCRPEMQTLHEAQAEDGDAAPYTAAGQNCREAAILLRQVIFASFHHDVSIIMFASYPPFALIAVSVSPQH
jgi:hypothetical protein